MELAGLKVVMDADFSAVENAFAQANAMASQFAANVKNAFDNIGGGKFKFDTGASQAAQDAKAYAQAAREQAKATLDAAKAKDIEDKAVERANRSRQKEKDLYGQLVAESQELVRSYYNAAAAIIKNGDAAGVTAEQLEEMRIAALAGQEQLKSIEFGAGRFQRNVGNYSGALNGLRISAQQLSGEIPNFFQSLQIGLRAITNNIQPLITNIQQLKKENLDLAASGKPTTSIFKSVAGAFLNWQTALLVGVGLLAKYGPEIWEMVAGTKAANEEKKRLAETQKELNSIDQNAIKSAGQQIGELRTLEATMTNANLTMNQRTEAYNKAVKEYPGYLSNVSKDEALNGALAETINNKLIPAILAAARARAYQEKINKITAEQIDLEQKATDIIQKRSVAEVRAAASQKTLDERLKAAGRSKTEFGFSQIEEDVRKNIKPFEDLTVQLNENATARQKNKETIDQMAASLQKLNLQTGGLSTGESVNPISGSGKDAEKNADEFSGAIQSIGADMELYKDVLNNYGRNTTLQFGEGFIYTIDRIKAALPKMTTSLTSSLTESKDALTAFKKFLVESINGSLASIGTSLGDMFSGGKFDFIGGILNVIGSQLKELGKYLIEIGGIREVIDKALKSLKITGVGAIVAGVASIALGEVLQNAARKRTETSFASGGVVYGPTRALVGEYAGARGNPEVIAPLSKLTSILRQQNIGNMRPVPVVLNTRIQGSDLLLVQERATRAKNR
jgi:hypothetical protein